MQRRMLQMKELIASAPRFLFFTGKGWCRENIHVLCCRLRAGRSGETGFVDQHRPGIKPGRGAGNAPHRSANTDQWPAGPVGYEYRSGPGCRRISGKDRRTLPGRIAGRMPCNPSKNNYQEPALLRSRPSMNSPGSSAMTEPPGTTTMLSSIQRPRATP